MLVAEHIAGKGEERLQTPSTSCSVSPVMSRQSYRCEMTRSAMGTIPQHCIAAALLMPANGQRNVLRWVRETI